MKNSSKIITAFFLAATFIFAGGFSAVAQKMSVPIKQTESYQNYIEYFSEAAENQNDQITLLKTDAASVNGNTELRSEYNGLEGFSLYTGEASTVTWNAGVPAGWYTVRVTYFPEEINGSYARRQILVNGKIPYTEAAAVDFYCLYNDENGITQDFYGNDIRSAQVKSPMWQTVDVYDSQNYESTPLKFYLDENSTIGFYAKKEALTIHSVQLIPYKKLDTYEKVSAEYKKNNYTQVNNVCEIYEAEKCLYKSDPTIVPTANSNSSVSPHDNFRVRLNTLSGENWSAPGQFVVWEVGVKKAGLYRITFKTRQNYTKGLYSTRRLYINGEVPFAEANNIKFTYTDGWSNTTIGEDEGWLFYLNEGKNEIKLEAVLGDMGTLLREADDILSNLNDIYREILAITGPSPDQYRDYKFDDLIPDTLANLKTQRDRLEKIKNDIMSVTGEKGGDLSIFETLAKQLDTFIADSDKIPSGFSYFKTNIGSLGTWYTSALSQPIDIDQIIISSSDKELPKAKAGFFKTLKDSAVSFIASFIVDYNKIGNLTDNDNKPVTVWLTSGRDQMQILKVLIQNSFVKQSGINVKLENVEGGAVLKAVSAGTGPDVLLGSAVSDPVNYALRNAVYDLSVFKDIDDVKKRFYPESLIPFTFNGKLYALPETLSFDLLFYRSDILNEMNLSLPETWQDVIEIVSILQKSNMTFGLPATNLMSTYGTFMYQNGASLYAGNGESVLLTKEKNVDAFRSMVNFYKNYSLELSYNFVNRFRTGEIPIAVETIAAYNNLMVSAPEIDGMWGVALLPGVRQQDGSINYTGYLSASAALIFKNSSQPENAYEFLKWWTSSEVQTKFGIEIESIMGPSSRYLTANRESFEQLPWTKEELAVLSDQISSSRAIEEVPGSYYISRHLNNAFRAVVIRGEDIRDTLDEYTSVINSELTSKRQEFGLE